jgi:hypothetical protein
VAATGALDVALRVSRRRVVVLVDVVVVDGDSVPDGVAVTLLVADVDVPAGAARCEPPHPSSATAATNARDSHALLATKDHASATSASQRRLDYLLRKGASRPLWINQPESRATEVTGVLGVAFTAPLAAREFFLGK